jgi:hypothetical protein
MGITSTMSPLRVLDRHSTLFGWVGCGGTGRSGRTAMWPARATAVRDCRYRLDESSSFESSLDAPPSSAKSPEE